MNSVLAVSVCVIHTVANASNTNNSSRQAGPTSLCLFDRIMTLFALYLDPQTIVSPARLLHEVQAELFREIKAFFTQLKMSGKDERHKGEREREK